MNLNAPYFKFIEAVAEEYERETEYDGRTYTYCFYCDANIGDGNDHEKDCLHLKAQNFLIDSPDYTPPPIPEPEPETALAGHAGWKGLYCLKDDESKTVEAVNKHNAKNLLMVQLNDVKCLVPKEQYQSRTRHVVK